MWLAILAVAAALLARSYVTGFAGSSRSSEDFDRSIAALAALERDAYLREGGAGPGGFVVIRRSGRGYDALTARFASVDEAEGAIRARGGRPRTAEDAESGATYCVFDVSQPILVVPYPTPPSAIFFMSS